MKKKWARVALVSPYRADGVTFNLIRYGFRTAKTGLFVEIETEYDYRGDYRNIAERRYPGIVLEKITVS